MSNFDIRDEPSLLFYATLLCSEGKTGSDGAWQVAPFFCSLPYRTDCLAELNRLREALATRFPELIAFGDRRAAKAYKSNHNSITKPSYIKRLMVSGTKHSQLRNILQIASTEPTSGGLVFSIFEPRDLEKRLRPGYVPCLVSGSFLLHENEFQLNAFFRSQSIVEFGVQDLIFLRQFQSEVVDEINRRRQENDHQGLAPGSLNIQFGRIIVQRRMMRNRHGFVRRDTVVEPWLKVVEQFLQTRRLAY